MSIKSPRYPLMGRTPRGVLSNHGSSAIPLANEATDVSTTTRDHLVGRKLKTRWPDDNNFYEAVIVDYNPVQVLFRCNCCRIISLVNMS